MEKGVTFVGEVKSIVSLNYPENTCVVAMLQ